MAEADVSAATEPPASVVISNRRRGGTLFWTGKFLVLMAIVIGLFFIALPLYISFVHTRAATPETPNFAKYRSERAAQGAITAADGTVLGEFATEWREFVAFDDIPKPLVDAFLAAEDHEFYEHNGIYYTGVIRAARAVLQSGDAVQGGSTISQQVAKMHLSTDKSLWRKVREALLARRIERVYSKHAILSVYLNEIYLGSGAYGVQAASSRYFSKRLDELTLGEMALLAGLARRPAADSPLASMDRAVLRRNQVLKKMARHGFIEEAQYESEREKPIKLAPSKRKFTETSPYFAMHVLSEIGERYGKGAEDGKETLQEKRLRVETTVDSVVDHLAYQNIDFGVRKQDKRQGWRGPVWRLASETQQDLFLERAHQLYGEKPLEKGRRYLAMVTDVTPRLATVRVGKKTYQLPLKNAKWASTWTSNQYQAFNDIPATSLSGKFSSGDVIWVSAPENGRGEFRDWFLAKGANPRWLPPREPKKNEEGKTSDEVQLEQTPHPQGAIFTGDHRTGYVLALVGGEDFARSHYNRATQACRPPASTYKPIYYSLAFDQGYGMDTVLRDKPLDLAVIDPITGKKWIPENLGGTVDGKVSLEYSLVFSKNASSVDIFYKVAPSLRKTKKAVEVEQWARRLGFTSTIIPDRALALGASCTYLPELAGAFAIFAQNGKKRPWIYIKRVIDPQGNVLEDNTHPADPWLEPQRRLARLVTAKVRSKEAIPARAAFLMSKLLRQAIKSGFSSVVRQIEMPVAGKTGTSSDTMDTTFVAYNSHWLTTVWYGDDDKVRPLGLKDAAYMTVEPLWARYMHEASRGMPLKEFPWDVPDGVNPNDRGAHSKGVTRKSRMPLKYIKAPKPPGAAP